MMHTRTYPFTRRVRLGLNALLSRSSQLPSHYAKRDQILALARRHRLRTLVETGTYLGDMVWSLQDHFDRIYSIELDAALALRARQLFKRRQGIEIIAGDSAAVLPRVLSQLSGPALFWLDAHYSGGITAGADEPPPILEELRHVLANNGGHVVLIDDARLFDGTDGYPTLGDVEAMAATAQQSRRTAQRGDIICLDTPA